MLQLKKSLVKQQINRVSECLQECILVTRKQPVIEGKTKEFEIVYGNTAKYVMLCFALSTEDAQSYCDRMRVI